MDMKFMSTVLEKAVHMYLKIILLLRPKIMLCFIEEKSHFIVGISFVCFLVGM
jgi:hypothetical protein